jgi:phosphoenolpyruvate synthase/pyruvate phosphate dikinase
MKKRKGWHPTKRAWAEAKVAELRAEEARWRAEHLPTANWRGVRGKLTALETLGRERRRFERLAEQFRSANE